MPTRLTTILAACTLAATIQIAHAQPLTDAFTYQGRLLEGGTPANGPYDLEYRLFDAATAGRQIGPTLSRSSQPVTNGLFTQELNFGDQFNGRRAWLEIAVRRAGAGSFRTLPRQELTATPNALHAIVAEVADFALATNMSLDDAYSNGATINADAGPVIIQSPAGIDANLILGPGEGTAGRLRIDSATNGVPYFQVIPDASTGGGGILRINRNNFGDTGFQIDGNIASSQSAALSLVGNELVSFRTDITGDVAAILPQSSISSAELLNEPGLANRYADGLGVSIDPLFVDSVYQRTIIAPADGYIVAIATMELFIDRTLTIADTGAVFSLATAPNTFQRSLEFPFTVAAPLPVGEYASTMTIHATFPVTSGETTIHINAREVNLGDTTVGDIELTLIYIPTAYGSVGTAAGRPGDPSAPIVFDEPAASRAANDARTAAELQDLRQQVAELRALIAADDN